MFSLSVGWAEEFIYRKSWGCESGGNKISILAFEVANTVAKGANLFESLSEENVQFLKKEILHSEGVQELVSTDLKELLILAAADKRLLLVDISLPPLSCPA